MAESNLRPVHAGATKRCPDCGLACNAVAASNTAARDELGRPLPFTEEFIRDAQARTAAGAVRNRAAKMRPENRVTHPIKTVSAGRDW